MNPQATYQAKKVTDIPSYVCNHLVAMATHQEWPNTIKNINFNHPILDNITLS